ncbi:TrbI/VirB10 family protein [Anabaena sp. PCC 7108]|uniref:TrbI/VirB10 family protein n=1 Tax=Anabaena sp. PCC 7108 TaxID=163908 RepID=UPI0003471AE1|nr:TrbI/VirB10 family protein [Anabaena sp. PCC 7108]
MKTNLENRTESNKIDNLLNFAEDNSENNLAGTENQNIISEADVELADELELVETQHSLVNSPWSRTIVVGGGFGVGFILIFMFLNPMMNGKVTKKEQTPEVAATSPPEEEVPKQDGDIYAKLALQKQAEELEAFKEQNRIKQESPVEKQDKQTVENLPRTKTIPNKSVSRETSSTVTREQQPRRPIRTERPVREVPMARSSPPVQTVATSTILPKQQTTFKSPTKPSDPLAELANLRSLGSGGQIDYAAAITNEKQEVASTQTQNVGTSDYTPRRRSSYSRNSQIEPLETVTTNNSSSDLDSNFDNNNGGIEELKAKWTPVISAKSLNKSDKVTNFSVSKNYSPEEAAIIEGREEQYLRVGEYTTAILETPVVWSANVNSNNSHIQTKFVVKLTQPLMSNIGKEAIPANTLLSAEIQGVDSSGRVTAVVTAILKDGTEYTLRPGTIVIQGQGGEPLIANQYRDKGKEILSLDAGLGLMSGLAKVGEVINQPDIQSSISQSNGGFSSIQTSRNGNRSLLGAFAQGAFGTVSKQVEERNQKAIAEIMKRPNIWFIRQNTQITVQVNRSLRL